MLSPQNLKTKTTQEQIPLLQKTKPKIFNFNNYPRIRRNNSTITREELNNNNHNNSNYTPSNVNTETTRFSYFQFASYFRNNKNKKKEENIDDINISSVDSYEQHQHHHCNMIDFDDGNTTVYSSSSFSQSKYIPSYFQSSCNCKDILSPTSSTEYNDGNNNLDNNEYYKDNYNDLSYICNFGTMEYHGIWMNNKDIPGLVLSSLVWLLILYSGITITLLAMERQEPPFIAIVYCTICMLSLACHAKTALTDPGAVPESAVPPQSSSDKISNLDDDLSYNKMCSLCQTYKPEKSHHCKICNRCISRMDHHCPWMNNCIGAGNFKHFILFLIYTWLSSIFALSYFFFHYFYCLGIEKNCITYSTTFLPLIQFMSFFCCISLLFTTTILMNVIYGIMTGLGTIDRLKRKANHTFFDSDDEPYKFKDIFGVGPWYTWFLPIDPIFEDYDYVMGYCTTQRLLREETLFFKA